MNFLLRRIGLCALLTIAMIRPGHSQQEIGFIERFALAENREEALKELIPGTEEYYFFNALHFQNTGNQAGVDDMLEQWKKRFETSPLRKEIENRNALISYSKEPQKTLDYLKRELGLTFNHQRERQESSAELPTELDQNVIAIDRILKRTLANEQSLGEVSDAGIDYLMRNPVDLTPAQRRELLSKVKRPDYPNIVTMMAAELETRESRGFGEFPVHGALLLSQLDDLAKMRPQLLGDSNFVLAKLGKLRPGADSDMGSDPAVRESYLDAAWKFVSGLEPAFNSLKANILYQRLAHDRTRGIYDRERFLTYLQLPRPVSYINPVYRQKADVWRFPVDLNFDSSSATGFRPIINDDEIVRAYLLQFLAGAADYAPFAPYLTEDYLKPLLAEANIVSAQGDPEKWFSSLAPAAYQALKDRVDLDFDPTCKERFAAGEEVSLDLHVKHVEKLIVKIYEINTFNYYANFGQQLNTDLNLDGLVANEELSFEYAETPFHRVKRSFRFPQLNADRGVWVIEFIGNGKSSRALIRRGGLQYLTRHSTAGNVLTILNEMRQKIDGAFAWLNGTRYDPNAESEILIPFSNAPGSYPLILADGQGFATLENFSLQGEQYALSAGFHVDREELLATGEATVAVRPSFTLNGAPGDVELLEEVTLTIVSTGLDGVPSSSTVPDFKLFPHKESTHTFRVPDGLASLSFQLDCKVKSTTQSDKVALSASDTVSINQIKTTDQVSDLFLSKVDGKWRLQELGRTGEAKRDSAINLNLRRDDFRTDVRVTLKTDANGTIDLGELDGIYRVRATASNGRDYRWILPTDRRTYPRTIHARRGETISIPWLAADAGRGELSLLQRTMGSFVSDHFDAITLRDGFLAIQNLPAGDYSLLVKEAAWEIELRITEGEESNGFLMSDVRNLEHRNPQSMQISEVKPEGDDLVVRLINANAYTRVHVFADKFLPPFDAYSALGKSIGLEPLSGTPARFRNMFVSGRAIGDEYRYIIERRYAKTFPGNMLQRPGLLLNPWAIRSTDTATDDAEKGQDWERSDAGVTAAMQRPASESTLKRSAGQQDPHAIDFLAQQAVVSYNLAPGDDGEIRIKLADLGDRQYVRVLAVDAADAVERHIALPSRPTEIKDLRLADGLNPKRHYTQKNQVTVLEPGKPFEIQDAGTAAFEAYDSIGSVYRLFKTLGNGDAKLEEFSFITGWAEFEETRKRELYSKYACHELSFFLQRKDPEFFASVVQPYLRNKKDKTFLDHYLVGNDLSPWLEAWRFAQLNIVERILLAERLPEQRPSIERNVSDALALLPPEQRLGYWNFDAGLAGSALEFDSFGMEPEGLGLQERLKSVNRKASLARGAVMLGETAVPELQAAPAAIPAPPGEPGADLFFAKKAEAADKETLGRLSARRQLGETATLADDVADEKGVTRDARFAGGRRLADREARMELRQLYRKLDQTREWAENNYYHMLIEQQNADLVTVNKFWYDFAARDPQKPFLSRHLTEASRNFTEMMFALAVLDLPMDGSVKEADVKLDGIKLTMTPSGPVILFHKETEETAAAGQTTQLLVSQNFFRQGDRYQDENGERVDKFVTDEFLTGIVYACQTVVTNPTSTPQRLSLLRQIPLGAIAVNNSKPTDHSDIHLGPYQTQTVEYFFYFPVAGDFAHFPVHVAKGEKVVAFAEPVTLHVVDEPTTTDTTSWAYISQRGTDEEILSYLSTNNLLRLDLSKVAWRCRESDAFFRRLVELLDSRHSYDGTIYSYGIHHNIPAPMRQYLLHADAFLAQCGSWLDTELVTIDPVERKNYQHLEYSPLVNPRTYSLGGVRKILNDRFREQYLRLMQILARRPALDDVDRMTLTYYLFLQDRIDEALATFAKVNADALPTRLQHDYFRCYAAFYTGDTSLARTVAGQYEAYHVDRWRNLFQEVAGQLDEIDGKAPGLVDDADRSQQQNQLASTDPSFSFKVENRSAELTYRNLKEVVVNYYRMDLEFLFSTNPFVASDTGRFSVIKPNRTDRLALDPDKDTISIALPGEFDGENVLIEIVGAGTHQAQAYYANTLNVQLARNYSQLQVMNSGDGKPVSKAYVKVYAEIAGQPKFYKDGYTDLRGKFDYTSLNTNELDQVSRFSILVMSEANGSLVTETTPPQR